MGHINSKTDFDHLVIISIIFRNAAEEDSDHVRLE
jgi:hypothetical protein